MHSAPSVEYPVGRSAFERRIEAALALAWLLMQAAWAWALAGGPLPGAWWFSGLLGLLACLALRWRARAPVVGRLCWERAPRAVARSDPSNPSDQARQPGRWVWRSAAYRHGTELAELRWSLDLQCHVLLHARNAAGLGWWIWLSRDSAPGNWDALRAALVAWREAGVRAGPDRH